MSGAITTVVVAGAAFGGAPAASAAPAPPAIQIGGGLDRSGPNATIKVGDDDPPRKRESRHDRDRDGGDTYVVCENNTLVDASGLGSGLLGDGGPLGLGIVDDGDDAPRNACGADSDNDGGDGDDGRRR